MKSIFERKNPWKYLPRPEDIRPMRIELYHGNRKAAATVMPLAFLVHRKQLDALTQKVVESIDWRGRVYFEDWLADECEIVTQVSQYSSWDILCNALLIPGSPIIPPPPKGTNREKYAKRYWAIRHVIEGMAGKGDMNKVAEWSRKWLVSGKNSTDITRAIKSEGWPTIVEKLEATSK